VTQSIRIALPKGRLLNETSALAVKAEWGLSDYSEGARLYHLNSIRFPELSGKIFHEKDIPIQVATGNYDLGICGLDWIQELTVKYPGSGLVKVADLYYGGSMLFLAASNNSNFTTLTDVQNLERVINIASEYPNLAESIALNSHFKRFNIFPVWGAVEIYPPENADLILISNKSSQEAFPQNLHQIAGILNSSAFLIANRNSWETKDLSELINSIFKKRTETSVYFKLSKSDITIQPAPLMLENSIRLALPDGHAQKHVVNIFNKARIKITDYPSAIGNRRPKIEIPDIEVKVIRPQDMPLQVVNGKFDLAITGKDWVKEHLYKFPSSPIVELVDLKYSWVKIVAAIHNDVSANNIRELRQLAIDRGWQLRIASEYVTIADKFARDNHLGIYQVIPTWGATEAFVPDDADILIENTETGNTLKRHNLKIIETLFESTACLIANSEALNSPKLRGIESLAAILRKAVEEN
jgi:ATP phosphoribosyltransferase